MRPQRNEWMKINGINLNGFICLVGERARKEQINYLFVNEGVSEAWLLLSFCSLGGLWAGRGPMAPPKRANKDKKSSPLKREWIDEMEWRELINGISWKEMKLINERQWNGINERGPKQLRLRGKSILFFSFCWPAEAPSKKRVKRNGWFILLLFLFN